MRQDDPVGRNEGCAPSHRLSFIDADVPCATGYGTLIRAYVQFMLSKLRFHRHHSDFNGLFEYEEYVSLRGIDDPNEGSVLPSSPSRSLYSPG